MKTRTWSLPIVLLASCATSSVSHSQVSHAPQADASDLEIDRGRKIVRQAAEDDYFFWNRFLNRLDTPVEFGLPVSWYTPNRLIEGGIAAPFPVSDEDSSAVSDQAWEKVSSWARARKTDTLIVLKDGVIERQFWEGEAQPGALTAVRSLAKTLPALLLGVAIEEGAIQSVEEPLVNYIPEWKNDPRGAITLRQVLNKASGLASVGVEYQPDNLQIRLAEGRDVNAVALGWPYEGAPDSQWPVNQVDTQLLAIVLERATGEDYGDYLSTRLWQPLGAGTATINTDANDVLRAYCCMRARLYDWARVGEMLRHGGRIGEEQIIPEAWLEEMQRPSPTNPYMGYHLWLGWQPGTPEATGPTFMHVPHSEPYRADDVFYMLGGGIVTVWVVPSRGLTIVRGGGNPDLNDWDHSYIVNAVIDDLNRQ